MVLKILIGLAAGTTGMLSARDWRRSTKVTVFSANEFLKQTEGMDFNPSRPVGGEANSQIETQLENTYIQSFEIVHWNKKAAKWAAVAAAPTVS
jgi:hypothetical protein